MIQRTVTLTIAITLMVISSGTTGLIVCEPEYENIGQVRFGILISPIITETLRDEIEIYWNNIVFQVGDRIELYNETLSLNDSKPLYIVNLTSSNGVVKTGIRAEPATISNPFEKQCLKYHVAWIRENTTNTTCLKTEPFWMYDRRDILASYRISELFIPGTHNSAAYLENGTANDGLLTNYAVTQDIDVFDQLIRGVRYLDIRVGFYPYENENWWTFHGILYRSVPLKSVIEQVKIFLDNTREIVIFDVHEFSFALNNDLWLHRQLVLYLEEHFRGYYLRTDHHRWYSTMGDIWSSGKRLIIGYAKREIPNMYNSMWPSVLHRWGDVRSVENLYNYLNEIEANSRDDEIRPRSAMAQLTPNEIFITMNLWSTLRHLANKVNANVTTWYSTVWQYNANIVAVDFVRNTDIVDVAIKSNENRHLYCEL